MRGSRGHGRPIFTSSDDMISIICNSSSVDAYHMQQFKCRCSLHLWHAWHEAVVCCGRAIAPYGRAMMHHTFYGRAIWKMFIGSVVVLVVSDPMVDVLSE